MKDKIGLKSSFVSDISTTLTVPVFVLFELALMSFVIYAKDVIKSKALSGMTR